MAILSDPVLTLARPPGFNHIPGLFDQIIDQTELAVEILLYFFIGDIIIKFHNGSPCCDLPQ